MAETVCGTSVRRVVMEYPARRGLVTVNDSRGNVAVEPGYG